MVITGSIYLVGEVMRSHWSGSLSAALASSFP